MITITIFWNPINTSEIIAIVCEIKDKVANKSVFNIGQTVWFCEKEKDIPWFIYFKTVL